MKRSKRSSRAAAVRASNACHNEAHDNQTWDKAGETRRPPVSKTGSSKKPAKQCKGQGKASGKAPAKSQSKLNVKQSAKPPARQKNVLSVASYFTTNDSDKHADIAVDTAAAEGDAAPIGMHDDDDEEEIKPAASAGAVPEAHRRGRTSRQHERGAVEDHDGKKSRAHDDDKPRGKENEVDASSRPVLAETDEVLKDNTNILRVRSSKDPNGSSHKAPATQKEAGKSGTRSSRPKSSQLDKPDRVKCVERAEERPDPELLPDAPVEDNEDEQGRTGRDEMEVSPARAAELPVNPRDVEKNIDLVPKGLNSPTPMDVDDEDLPDSARSGGAENAKPAVKFENAALTKAFGVVMSEMRTMREVVDTMHGRLDGIEASLGEHRMGPGDVKRGRLVLTKKGVLKVDTGLMDSYNAIMSKTAPNIQMYFPEKAWAHAILFAAFDDMWTYSVGQTFSLQEVFYGLSSIFFSLANSVDGRSRDSYKGDVGLRASKYRRKVLSGLLDLARAGTYGPVIPDEKDVALEAKPYWLGRKGTGMYITEAHISAGQKQFETKTSNTPEYNRRLSIGSGVAPTPDDIAEYVMATLYKIMTEKFRSGRRRVAEDFCEMIGYLFVTWASLESVHVSDEFLMLRRFQARADMHILPFSDINHSWVEDTEDISANEKNKILFGKMFKSREYRLWACHDILISGSSETKSEGVRHPEGKNVRRFKREMSLLAPVAKMFMSWAGFKGDMSLHELLRFHKQSMRVMYGVTVVIRDVLDCVVARQVGDGIKCKTRANVTRTDAEKDMLMKLWNLLLPGKTLMERAVFSSTCAVTEKFYEANRYISVRELVRKKEKEPRGDADQCEAKEGSGHGRQDCDGAVKSRGGSGDGQRKTSARAHGGKVPVKSPRKCLAQRENSAENHSDDDDEPSQQPGNRKASAKNLRATQRDDDAKDQRPQPRRSLVRRIFDSDDDDEDEADTVHPTPPPTDYESAVSDPLSDDKAHAESDSSRAGEQDPDKEVQNAVAAKVADLDVDEETEEDDLVEIPDTPPRGSGAARAGSKVDTKSLILPEPKKVA